MDNDDLIAVAIGSVEDNPDPQESTEDFIWDQVCKLHEKELGTTWAELTKGLTDEEIDTLSDEWDEELSPISGVVVGYAYYYLAMLQLSPLTEEDKVILEALAQKAKEALHQE